MHIKTGFMNQGRWFPCPECPMVLSWDHTISFTCDSDPHFQRRRITTLLSPNPKKKGLVFFVAANILEGANTLAGLRNERARGFEANTHATAARTMPQECRPQKALPGSASRAWQEEKERKKRKPRHVRPQLSLGNGRFGAWNAEAAAAERLHPAPLPHRRRLCPAAALPSLKQNNQQKKPPQVRQRKRRERKKEGLKKKKKKKD